MVPHRRACTAWLGTQVLSHSVLTPAPVPASPGIVPSSLNALTQPADRVAAGAVGRLPGLQKQEAAWVSGQWVDLRGNSRPHFVVSGRVPRRVRASGYVIQ